MNVDLWASERYEIARPGHSGRQRLVMARKRTPSISFKGATTYLDVGIVKRIEEDVQEVWRPRIPFTIADSVKQSANRSCGTSLDPLLAFSNRSKTRMTAT